MLALPTPHILPLSHIVQALASPSFLFCCQKCNFQLPELSLDQTS